MKQKKREKAKITFHSVLIVMLLLGNCWMITLASSPSTGTNSRQCQQPVCYYFEEIPSLQEFTTWKREVMDIVKEENLKEYLTDWLQDIDTIEEILISLEKPKRQAHEEKEEEQKKPKEKTNKFAALLKQYQVKKSIFSFAPVNQKGKLITIGRSSKAHLVSKSPLIAVLDELFREGCRASELVYIKKAKKLDKLCWEISAKYLGKTHPMTTSMSSRTTILTTQDALGTSHNMRISCKYFEEIPSLTHFTIWKEYVISIANSYRLERFLGPWLKDIQTIAKIIASLENKVTEEQENEDEETEVKEEEKNEENEVKEESENQKKKGGKNKKKPNKFAALMAQYQVEEQGVMDILLGRPNPVAKKYQLSIIGKTTRADRISVDAAIAVLDEISREINRRLTTWKLFDLRDQIALVELQEQHKLTQMLTFNPLKALKNVITKKSLPVNVHKKND